MESIKKEPDSALRNWRRLVALAAAVALLTVTVGAGVASAQPAHNHHGDAATFTKWVTVWPTMAGVVGGSAGAGVFSGKVLDYNPGPTTVIAAIYHFGGSRHDFTALMHVEQTGLHADLVGVVIDGWGKGKLVTGEYTQITCAHDGITTDCFRGSVEVAKGRD
ncbi:MAG: hypothetical protein ABIP77_08075 [Candidatus Limnocylindrales bacterium]